MGGGNNGSNGNQNNNNNNKGSPFGGSPLSSSLSQRQKQQQRLPLYLPSVYRYSCQGMFSVSTDTPGSVGTCHGLRSNLEHVLDMNISSRHEALDSFTSQQLQQSSNGGGGDEEEEMLVSQSQPQDNQGNDSSTRTTTRTSEEQQHSDAVWTILEDKQVNPALIYRRHRPHSKLPNNKNNDKKQQSTHDLTAVEAATTDKNNKNEYDYIMEEDEDAELQLDKSLIVHESWQAYGSTEIECLQLTNVETGNTDIVAVAPYNHALVSNRQVELHDDNNTHVTCVQIGLQQKIMFVLESSTTTTGSHNNNDKDNNTTNKDPHATELGNKNQNDNNNNNKNDQEKKSLGWNPFDMALSSSLDDKNNKKKNSLQQVYDNGTIWGKHTIGFGTKILSHIQWNGIWLYEHSYEWAEHTIVTGQRIVQFMPPTAKLLYQKCISIYHNHSFSSSSSSPPILPQSTPSTSTNHPHPHHPWNKNKKTNHNSNSNNNNNKDHPGEGDGPQQQQQQSKSSNNNMNNNNNNNKENKNHQDKKKKDDPKK